MTSKSLPAAEPLPAPSPSRRFTDAPPGHVSIVGAGLRLIGGLTGADSLELGGVVEGDIEIEGLCHVRETARVSGSIMATSVLVEGVVEGDGILAQEKVEIRSRARVVADVEAATFAVAEGCFFEGKVHMRGGGAGQVSFQEKRVPNGTPSSGD